MSDEVKPITGDPAPAAPAPAPIPRRTTRFRTATAPNLSQPMKLEAFPVSQGIPPILVHADGYVSVEIPQSQLNSVVPSFLNCASRIFLTCQRLSTNDKFLKETGLYDPDFLELYISFVFIYHTLRVRNTVGQLSDSESTLLSHLEREYPVTALPVPGTIVDVLQSITATENPYSWLGNVTAAPPSNGAFRSATSAFVLNTWDSVTFPNPLSLIAQVIGRYARARATTDNFGDIDRRVFNLARGRITGADPERWWLTTPHFRFSSTLNLRVAQAFHDSVHGSAVAPHYDRAVLDFPVLPANNNAANSTLTTYMGLTDHGGIANRTSRFRRWPLQAASMMSIACKYISSSRHLSDIPITGLGALTHIEEYVMGMVVEMRDPHAIQGGNAADEIAIATTEQYHIESLSARMNVRDPVASDLSSQYAMLAQVNPDLTHTVNRNGELSGIGIGERVGPFWDYPICEHGPEAAVANILISHLPNYVRSVPRRNADE
jgi:hypothetical protein